MCICETLFLGQNGKCVENLKMLHIVTEENSKILSWMVTSNDLVKYSEPDFLPEMLEWKYCIANEFKLMSYCLIPGSHDNLYCKGC